MNILLINPALTGQERYGFAKKSGSYLPPLGLLYIATYLKKFGYTVFFIDELVERLIEERLIKVLRENDIFLVGLSVLTPTYKRALYLSELIKKIRDSIYIVFGGPHPSALPEESLENNSVDFVIRGEGEIALERLASNLLNKRDVSEIKNLCFKRGGKVYLNEVNRIQNLDDIPYPDRSFLKLNNYRPSIVHYKNLPSFPVITSRGCPYHCKFCACSKVFGKKVTQRTVDNVIEEIKILIKDFGVREIMIWDDIFGFNENWLLNFCEKIRDLKIEWSCWMRCDLIREEIIRDMKKSGCWNISMGVESGDDMILYDTGKGINKEQIFNAFNLAKKHAIETRATFILGLPEDNKESIEKTIKFAIELEPDYAQFQLFTPYPGTFYWDLLLRGGWKPVDYEKYTIWNVVYTPKGINKEELQKLLRKAYKSFYFRRDYILRSLKKIKNLNDIVRLGKGMVDIL